MRPATGQPRTTKRGDPLQVWCGIDWAERHHDIALVDQDAPVTGHAADHR